MLGTKVLFQRMKVRTRSIDFTSVTFISMQLCETRLRLETKSYNVDLHAHICVLVIGLDPSTKSMQG